MEGIRIHKIMADSGYCSRRKAELLIKQGKVKLNGHPVKLGDKAGYRDIITVDGERIYIPKKKNFIYSPANKRMEEEMSKELAPLLGLMLARKITTRTLIKQEFGIDYKTIAKLVDGGKPIATVTILKLSYVIPHYLHLEKLKLEKLDSAASEVEKRMDILNDLDRKYRALYGFLATFVLQQIKNKEDLRQMVKPK